MSDQEEWGPWIEHDGKGYPVAHGTIAQVVRANGSINTITVGVSHYRYRGWDAGKFSSTKSWWHWVGSTPGGGEVVRYRIRKPRGLTLLEDLIADLPAPVQPEGVPA